MAEKQYIVGSARLAKRNCLAEWVWVYNFVGKKILVEKLTIDTNCQNHSPPLQTERIAKFVLNVKAVVGAA